MLEGYCAQDTREFDLLVADDGSTDETRALVEFAARSPFRLTHVWQEDQGLRAGAARNWRSRQLRPRCVIFSDGDCVPPPFS